MIKTAMVLIIILHGYKDAPYTEKFIGKVPNCLNETLEPLTEKLKEKYPEKMWGYMCIDEPLWEHKKSFYGLSKGDTELTY
mgnify:FL=1